MKCVLLFLFLRLHSVGFSCFFVVGHLEEMIELMWIMFFFEIPG